jgi:hypothetical protein
MEIIMPDQNDPHIKVGREDALPEGAPKPEDAGSGSHHPLPASEKARHGSIPESLEEERGHGAQ